MNRNAALEKIGIKDPSFEFLTIAEMVERGLIEKPLDGNHGETHPKENDFVDSGVPFIMASDIKDGVVDYVGCKFITRKQADSLRKGFARNGDVLLTHKATIGRTAIVKYDEQPYIMLTPQVTYYRVRDHQKLDHRYLRYCFESSFFQGILALWAGAGSTRAYLGITDQGKLPFVLPPIKKQKKIAAILSAYDDLIENNRRRIALLEKMAEEIYREWFVRMRFPGHEQARFEKGVPKGWELTPFSELVEINPSERLGNSDLFPFVGMENLSLSSMYFQAQEQRKGGSGPKFRNRDTVFPRITPSLENGKRGFVMTLEDGQVGFGSTEFIVFREKVLSAEHIYLLSCSPGFRKHAELSMSGASGRQRVSEDCFTFFLVRTPPPDIRKHFSKTVRPIFDQVKNLARQVEHCARSRDALLGRLISGKLDVENLDIQFPPSMLNTPSPQPSPGGRGSKAAAYA